MTVKFFRHDAFHNNLEELASKKPLLCSSVHFWRLVVKAGYSEIRVSLISFIRQQDGNKAVLDPTLVVEKPQKYAVKDGDPGRT